MSTQLYVPSSIRDSNTAGLALDAVLTFFVSDPHHKRHILAKLAALLRNLELDTMDDF